MTMTLSGDGTITGLTAGGLPNATVTADDLASGAAVSNIGYTPTNQQAENINFRNRIINGDMRIDQRNAGASVTQTTAAVYSVDRFFTFGSVASKFSIQQNAGSVTPPPGFTNYLGATSLSAYSIASGTEQYVIAQYIEGFNTADLAWGTANARPVTISFWVRSSLTGTFGGSLRNNNNSRAYPFAYTISAADTWEYKTVTIAGETTGTWLTNNDTGIRLTFALGAGATVSGTAGAWVSSTNLISVTGATSVVGTNGATWYITGVQLEVGSVATPFERRPYGTELMLCQRYFVKFGGNVTDEAIGTFGTGASATTSRIYVPLPVSMRAVPSASFSTLELIDSVNPAIAVTSIAVGATVTGPLNGFIVATVASGLTTYRPYALRAANSLSGHLSYSAEL